MSAVLETIIARGFNLNQPEFGRNMIQAKNNRQVIDSNLQSQDVNRRVNEYSLQQLMEQAAQQKLVGQGFSDLQSLQADMPRIEAAQQTALANSNNLQNIRPELRARAAEMLMGPVTDRQSKAMNLILQNSPEAQNAMAEQMFKAQVSPYQTLSDVEKQQLGLPADKAFQRDPTTGKISQIGGSGDTINVGGPPSYQLTEIMGPDGNPIVAAVNKNDPTDVQQVGDKPQAPASSKDRSLISTKLQQIQLARQQLANIRSRFTKIQNSLSAGPIQGSLPTPDGQAFDSAVDPLRQTILALTRVPGIGAQSDREAAIAQAPLPNRANYEDVTAQQIEQIDQMLSTLESGYTGMMDENPQTGKANSERPKIKIDANGNIVE